MDTFNYIYNGKLWRSSATVSDKNSFFHSTLGVKSGEDEAYFDKSTKFRRMRWAAFLTYFENEIMPLPLVERLRKCLFANDKYKDVSLDDKDHLENYLSDIMKAEHDVTMEEVPILATLENMKIVLFSDRGPDPVFVNPDAEILGSYPYMGKAWREVVLCLKKNIFSRLKPVYENSLSESVTDGKEIVEPKYAEITVEQFSRGLIKYKKSGNAGSEGVQFQVSLLTVFFLNALRKLKDWKLSTENKEAGKFDDVVLEWPQGATLLQAKHKQSKTKRITFEDLLSTNPKNDDFSLPKYFLSYEEIRNKFKLQNVIICTNASIDGKSVKFLKCERIGSESLLHYEGCRFIFYTFNEEILPYLKKNVKTYYEKNYRNKVVDETIITDENIKDFLRHLQFYSSYPLESDIGKITEELLSHIKHLNILRGQISSLELYSKVMDWFQQKDGVCLTEDYAKALISEIQRDKRWQKLENYNVTFRHNELNFQNPKRLFHIVAGDENLLQEIKIVRTLWADKTKVLHIAPDDGIEVLKQVVEAFGLPRYTILIFIWPEIIEESAKMEISRKLREILKNFGHKKIIFLAENSDKLPQLNEYSCDVINNSVTFNDLSIGTQEKLLNKKNIVFQGNYVSLEELLVTQTNEDCTRFLESGVLESIVKEKEIKVGDPLLNFNERTTYFYIKRKFKRHIRRNEKDEEAIVRDEILSEEKVYEATQKIILIADSAGTGKSTVLTNIAITVKKNNPHLWVIRIDLNDYTKFLKELLEKNRKSVTVMELLNSKNGTELTNHLEESVFAIREKIVLLLDGFDEISPDYTELILGLLAQCQKEANFAKIVITTRPHVTNQLEENLQVKPFILEPFTEQNQVDFLTAYWVHNLGLGEAKKGKCELYAKAVIGKIIYWMKPSQQGENHFAAVPLQVRMLAEIFQEGSRLEGSVDWKGCKEYLVSDETEPQLPKDINIKRLYEMFIEKKRSIFIEKGNPSGNTAANQALTRQFDECLCYQRSLALELILNKEHCELFSCYQQDCRDMETNILKIGIVQKLDNQYHFIHRTFAEYFVAESLLNELQLQNQNADFQRFFIEEILLYPEYSVTRIFFNNFLQHVVDLLPSTVLQKYRPIPREIIFFSKFGIILLLRNLAGEGHVAILKLISKHVDFTVMPNYYKKQELHALFDPESSLNFLKSLVQQVGINVEDERCKTPLHYAVEGRHLEMVRFLVEQGANVNVGQLKPLHQAVERSHFEMTTFLVERGADITEKNLFGHTILYTSVKNSHTAIATYLLERVLKTHSLNEKYILYTAAYLGQLNVLEDLLRKGAEVNDRVEEGEPLLFGAVRGRQLKTIEYLVQKGADINGKDYSNNTALHIISEIPSLFSTAKLLVDLGIDLDSTNVYGSTALHLAVDRKNFDLIKLLVNSGANMYLYNGYGTTALHVASSRFLMNTIKFLLEHGANVNHRDECGNTALHMAIRYDIYNNLFQNSVYPKETLDTIKFIIKSGSDVNIRNNTGRTALHLAAESGDLAIVKFLMDVGAKVIIGDNNGCTALHSAIKVYDYCKFSTNIGSKEKKCYLDIVKTLVAKNSRVITSKDKTGSTPLHLAASKNHLEVVELFVELIANIYIRDNKGRSALHVAAVNGHLDTAKFLIEECNGFEDIIDNDGRNALHLATREGQLEILKLLEKWIDLANRDFNGCSALHVAAESATLDTVSFLVEFGIDVNVTDNRGHTALHSAVRRNGLDIVKFLVRSGVNVSNRNDEGHTALYAAAAKGYLDIVDFLIIKCNGVEDIVDDHGRTALHLEARDTELETVELLKLCGMEVNIRDNYGCTPLHYAARRGDLDIVRKLVLLKADITIKDNKGSTALHYATDTNECTTNTQIEGKCFLDIVKVLVTECNDVINFKDGTGCTALLLAASNGHLDIVELFIKCNADVNIQDNEGCTALCAAATNGHWDTVKYLMEESNEIIDDDGRTTIHLTVDGGKSQTLKSLVECGQNIDIRDNSGYTALHLAAKKGNSETVKFLIDVGADVTIRDHNGSTALHHAAKMEGMATFCEMTINNQIRERECYLDIVKILVGECSGVIISKDKTGCTAMHWAASKGHLDVVKLLVEFNADAYIKDYDGRTALHAAAANGHLDTVKFFVEEYRGIEEITDIDSLTALHLAARKSPRSSVECGMDVGIKDNRGRSVLHLAAESGSLDTVMFLVESGVDVNVEDNNGDTALHLASSCSLDVVELLVTRGANVTVKDCRGYTPAMVAKKSGRRNVFNYLQKKVNWKDRILNLLPTWKK